MVPTRIHCYLANEKNTSVQTANEVSLSRSQLSPNNARLRGSSADGWLLLRIDCDGDGRAARIEDVLDVLWVITLAK